MDLIIYNPESRSFSLSRTYAREFTIENINKIKDPALREQYLAMYKDKSQRDKVDKQSVKKAAIIATKDVNRKSAFEHQHPELVNGSGSKNISKPSESIITNQTSNTTPTSIVSVDSSKDSSKGTSATTSTSIVPVGTSKKSPKGSSKGTSATTSTSIVPVGTSAVMDPNKLDANPTSNIGSKSKSKFGTGARVATGAAAGAGIGAATTIGMKDRLMRKGYSEEEAAKKAKRAALIRSGIGAAAGAGLGYATKYIGKR